MLGDGAEEVATGDDAGDATVVDDRDDEHPVVQERLGDLRVGEVGAHLDALGVHVLGDRIVATGGTLLERGLQGTRDKARVLELGEVAGEQRGEELALAEDAASPAVRARHRQSWELGFEYLPHGVADGVVGGEHGAVADERIGDGSRAHHRYLRAM